MNLHIFDGPSPFGAQHLHLGHGTQQVDGADGNSELIAEGNIRTLLDAIHGDEFGERQLVDAPVAETGIVIVADVGHGGDTADEVLGISRPVGKDHHLEVGRHVGTDLAFHLVSL